MNWGLIWLMALAVTVTAIEFAAVSMMAPYIGVAPAMLILNLTGLALIVKFAQNLKQANKKLASKLYL